MLATTVCPAKTDEPIKMPFGDRLAWSKGNVLDRSADIGATRQNYVDKNQFSSFQVCVTAVWPVTTITVASCCIVMLLYGSISCLQHGFNTMAYTQTDPPGGSTVRCCGCWCAHNTAPRVSHHHFIVFLLRRIWYQWLIGYFVIVIVLLVLLLLAGDYGSADLGFLLGQQFHLDLITIEH